MKRSRCCWREFETGRGTLDILRRLHIDDVETLACAGSRAVVSYRDIPVVADSTLVNASRRFSCGSAAGRSQGR